MDFYTLSYVESLAVGGQTWGFIIFVAVLLALLVLGIQVLLNGFTSRYRDLMVILSLIGPKQRLALSCPSPLS